MGRASTTVVADKEVRMETQLDQTLDDDRFRAVIYQFLQVSGLMLRTREHYAAAVGVTPPQFSILTAAA